MVSLAQCPLRALLSLVIFLLPLCWCGQHTIKCTEHTLPRVHLLYEVTFVYCGLFGECRSSYFAPDQLRAASLPAQVAPIFEAIWPGIVSTARHAPARKISVYKNYICCIVLLPRFCGCGWQANKPALGMSAMSLSNCQKSCILAI